MVESDDSLRSNNHYVPRLYLKGWTSGTKIWTYRLLVSRDQVPAWKPHSIRSVAAHRHLYTYLTAGGMTDEFERWIDQEFEAPAEPAIQKVLRNERLYPEDWRRLIRFLAVQDVRTPARLIESLSRQREALPQLMDQTLRDLEKRLMSAQETGVFTPAEIPENAPIGTGAIKVDIDEADDPDMARISVTTNVGRQLWLSSIEYLLTHTIEHLLKHRWTIMRPADGVAWPTSDNPVVKLNYENSRKYNLGGGWGSQGSEIFLPLGPEHLLYTRIGHKSPQRYAQSNYGISAQIKRIIVENAHRMVFSSSIDPEIEQIRPRVVDAAKYEAEQREWRDWAGNQLQAEAKFLAP